MDNLQNEQDIAQTPEQFQSPQDYQHYCRRHSTAHLMAYAIQELYPNTKFAFGPPTKDGLGFYYDVDLEKQLNHEDLENIEKKMKELIKKNEPFLQEHWTIQQAQQWFQQKQQTYKLEQIQHLQQQGHTTVSIYKVGNFVDLCAGPHVKRTKECKHFKLLHISGAFWKGDPQQPQLQRIYGTVWKTKKELQEYLELREKAQKNDHRKLGVELELIQFHPLAPGIPFFLPKGTTIYHILQEKCRQLLLKNGYVEVKTPQLFKQQLWEISGHWDHFQENMFVIPQKDSQEKLSLKPMNCPAHMLIFKSKRRSYKELPLRIHDQGVLFRNEASGTLSGLTRVRQLCQDDAHIFTPEKNIHEEIERILELQKRIYNAFQLSSSVELATKPQKAMGDPKLWQLAENALESALKNAGLDYKIAPGEGAFYGPKMDFMVQDSLRRTHQCSTVQLDFQLPRNFQLHFINQHDQEEIPVVIHRAIYGSFERFIAILIEHYGGAFPLWLAPVQCILLPISEKFNTYALQIQKQLENLHIRTETDLQNERCGAKIRRAELMKIPYMLVVGEKEQNSQTVSVRSYQNGQEGTMPLTQFLEKIQKEAQFEF